MVVGEEHSSFTCLPQQGTRREFYCSALAEVVLILCWTKSSKHWFRFSLTKNPQWHSSIWFGSQPTFFIIGSGDFKKCLSEMLQQTWVGSKPVRETGWVLWWPLSAVACLCWGEHLTSLASTHTLPLVSSNDLLTQTLIRSPTTLWLREGKNESVNALLVLYERHEMDLTRCSTWGLGYMLRSSRGWTHETSVLEPQELWTLVLSAWQHKNAKPKKHLNLQPCPGMLCSLLTVFLQGWRNWGLITRQQPTSPLWPLLVLLYWNWIRSALGMNWWEAGSKKFKQYKDDLQGKTHLLNADFLDAWQ